MLNAVAVKCIPSPPPPPLSPLCKGIRIPALLIFACAIGNQGKRLTYAYRIPLTIEIQKTSSSTNTCTVHEIRNPRRGIQNPTVPWIPSHGAKASCQSPIQKKKLQKRNRGKKKTNLTNGSLQVHNGSYI